MAPTHKSTEKAQLGKEDIIAAANRNLPRAILFLAQCYESPDRYI